MGKAYNDQLKCLENNLSESEANVHKLKFSWHRIDVNNSVEVKEVEKLLKEHYDVLVCVNYEDTDTIPYTKIRVGRMEFDGLNEIKDYFSILDRFLVPYNEKHPEFRVLKGCIKELIQEKVKKSVKN